MLEAENKTLQLGRYLVRRGFLSEQEAERARRQAESDGARIEAAILKLELIPEVRLLPLLGEYYRIPCVNLGEEDIDRDAVAALPHRVAGRHGVFPIAVSSGTLHLAVPAGVDLLALESIRLLTGLNTRAYLCRREQIQSAIRSYYGLGAESVERMAEDDDHMLEVLDTGGTETDARDLADTAPVVRFVDQLIFEALKDRATDIHIEPFENALRLRMRIDGVLFETPAPPGIQRFHPAIVSRIKIMADMDIAEKRLPQDGRVKLRVAGEELDLRISTVPTPHGESVGIRILRRSMMLMGMGELGMSETALDRVRTLIRRPNGIILVTGPTGSGKTTTLYSALNEINSEDKKIITIEDPVEYMLRGVNQIQVKPGIGLTFAGGLRSVLRHDPDVIMVGEIRDVETAEIAIRAALTGHLVFSTLHTNDAPGAVTRLLDMGIEPFLVASSLRAVMAQRLVRLLCPHCRRKADYDPVTLNRAGIRRRDNGPARLFQAAGCEHCRDQGYSGRTGIYEVFEVDDVLRLLIMDRADTETIRRKAVDNGMVSLRQDGWQKARQGVTSLEEILRATRRD